MTIHRVRIENFRGIKELTADLPPGGVIATGRNGEGKTSFVRAIEAALTGNGFDAAAITVDADRARVFVQLDDGTEITRSVGTEGSPRLTVTMKTEGGTAKPQKPAQWLANAVGSVLDPVALYLAKPKDRVEMILQAMPVRATEEQIRRWCPDVPDCLDVDLNRHGLRVVGDLHGIYYRKRTAANAAADEAKRGAERAAAAVEATPEPQVGPHSIDTLRAALESAQKLVGKMEADVAASRQARSRWETAASRLDGTRTEFHAAQERAEKLRAERLTASGSLASACRTYVDALQSGAYPLLDDLRGALRGMDDAMQAVLGAEAAEHALQTRIADAVAVLGEAPTVLPFELVDEARAVADKADAEFQEAARASAAAQARANLLGAAADAARRAADTATEADRLNGIVVTLAKTAPAELLNSANGIPGLTIDGDDVALDGVRMDLLCGEEQLRLAVMIAQRLLAGARHKILVVDGLERLDDEQQAAFARATEGWDVIASRVESGDFRLDPVNGGSATIISREMR